MKWAGVVSIPIYPGKNGALFHLSYRPDRSFRRQIVEGISETHDPVSWFSWFGEMRSNGEKKFSGSRVTTRKRSHGSAPA